MNIFVLDLEPKTCARYHNDKHVVKMVLESAQLLCGVHWVLGSSARYKLTHRNNSCALWTRECIENYIWLCDLGLELCYEYTYRYNRRHKSQDVIEWCLMNAPNLRENGSITKFPLVMPNECKTDDVVESYRRCYIQEKSEFAKWKNRETPEWYKL